MTLEAIKFKNGKLEILDQLKLPHASEYVELKSVQDGWRAINTMQVRGAPAIAIVGCLSLAVELLSASYRNFKELFDDVEQKLDYLVTARPTAVNMRKSRDALLCWLRNANEAEGGKLVVREIQERLIAEIESMLAKDLSDNRAVGEYGADAILLATNSDRSDASSSASAPSSVSILTHCNTGSLATAGYGTALGVVRSLHARGHLKHVYCTETRPYNQGARLTAYELVYDDIPATLICDSMAASLMKQGRVDAVVTGADQVALNGDTANKIGTYSLAVAANYHKIPFFIALPTTSFNPHQQSGEGIVVEERPAQEMTHVNGVPVAAPGINCWNPAFDVTPAALITGIITEHGVFKPEQMKSFCPANESSLLCDD